MTSYIALDNLGTWKKRGDIITDEEIKADVAAILILKGRIIEQKASKPKKERSAAGTESKD